MAGELKPELIRTAFGVEQPAHLAPATDLPPRPPAFCPGCPHRLVFCELRRLKAIVTGDIGCYTLGAVAPYGACHTVIDMGASLSMAHGMELARAQERTGRPVVGVIGRLHLRALRHHEHARHHLQRRHRHPLHPWTTAPRP